MSLDTSFSMFRNSRTHFAVIDTFMLDDVLPDGHCKRPKMKTQLAENNDLD